jgi:glycosyltransferase involved in cell wall biosynthesis
MEDIEIVVVNDCSPDPLDSVIMREYESRYPDKVHCIWHKKNTRLGGARNTGIKAAAGEFIYCLDSDDYIEPDLCEKMYGAMIDRNSDMAVCDFERIEGNKVIRYWESNGDFTSNEPLDRLKDLKNHSACAIMIRKSLITENDLFFHEQVFCEDLLCVLWYLPAIKIARVHEMLYHYVKRDNSISQGGNFETYKLGLEEIYLILNMKYFSCLDKKVKELVFLYLITTVTRWTLQVYMCHPDKIKYFNRKTLLLENALGSKVSTFETVSFQKNFVINILDFIISNSGNEDFIIEYYAYYHCQWNLRSLKACKYFLSKYKKKRITIWGAGKMGRLNAHNFSLLGVNFEVTDYDENLHGVKIENGSVVKPWSELQSHTDVVISSVDGSYFDIVKIVRSDLPNVEIIDYHKLYDWYL